MFEVCTGKVSLLWKFARGFKKIGEAMLHELGSIRIQGTRDFAYTTITTKWQEHIRTSKLRTALVQGEPFDWEIIVASMSIQ